MCWDTNPNTNGESFRYVMCYIYIYHIHLLYLISTHLQVEDYKLNLRCFDVFMRKHRMVFEQSLLYQELPENPSTPPRKRAYPNTSLSSDSPAPAKVKKKYEVSAELTESESGDEEE